MATYPSIGNEFVDLVQTMRQAQNHYFDMAMDRTGKYPEHQWRRALQASKTAEKRVDDWIAKYLQEARSWYAAQGDYKPDELPGFYNVERDR